MFNEETTNIILNKIKSRCTVNKKGCIIWHGSIDRNNNNYLYVKIGDKVHRITIERFFWNYNNPDNQLNCQSKLEHTCKNQKCVNISHIRRCDPYTKQMIWEKMLKSGERDKKTDCILWKGPTDLTGYGQMHLHRIKHSTHKVSFWLHNEQYEKIDDIPKKIDDNTMVIRHICGKSLCYNPSHLKLGTQTENMHDTKLHGTACIGEKNAAATITAEIAIAVKSSKYDPGHPKYKTQKERAELFGISRKIVCSIDNGESWAHLFDEENKRKKINEQQKLSRRKARERIWTPDMWQEARKKLLDNSEMDMKKNVHMGTPCRIWIGLIDKRGYGKTSIFGRSFRCHVLSCSIKNKMHLPENKLTRHLCSVKACINEDHLEFGTDSENGFDTAIHGSKSVKLNMKKAEKIRELYKTGKYTYAVLGEKYDVDATAICSIINNRTWKNNKNPITKPKRKKTSTNKVFSGSKTPIISKPKPKKSSKPKTPATSKPPKFSSIKVSSKPKPKPKKFSSYNISSGSKSTKPKSKRTSSKTKKIK
jgi:hypothetical protein